MIFACKSDVLCIGCRYNKLY